MKSAGSIRKKIVGFVRLAGTRQPQLFQQHAADEAVTRPGRPTASRCCSRKRSATFSARMQSTFWRRSSTRIQMSWPAWAWISRRRRRLNCTGCPLGLLPWRPLRPPAVAGSSQLSRAGDQPGGWERNRRGVTTFYCEEGYYTPMVKPGSEPCKRVNLVIPGTLP